MELFSHESESYVLSGMLASEHMLCLGIETLVITDFSSSQGQAIFCVMQEFYKANESPALSKLIIRLKDLGELEKIGGISGLTGIVGKYVSTVDDFNYYVNDVKSRSILRDIERVLSLLKEKIDGKEALSGFDFLPKCKELFERITDFQSGGLGKSFKEDCLNVFIPHLIDKRDGKIVESYLSTGFQQLDKFATGFGPGQLWTICARTGIGKTTMALNMALNLAMSKKNVFVFSMEMTNQEIYQRLLSQMTDIPHELIKTSKLSNEYITKFQESLESLTESSLVINDKGGLKINELCSIARRAKEHYGISAIFIDYIQLIEGNTPTEFRHLEIAQVTRSLKKLAKDLAVPVIALAQLSRKVEERSGQQIFLSDLKESGSIEEDSDVVLALSRRDARDPYDRPGEATLSILKNRHGQTGDVRLRFDKDKCAFRDLV